MDGARKIAAMPEDHLSEVKAKARAFARYEASDQWQRLKLACDMYVAAFFTPKVGEAPSPEHWWICLFPPQGRCGKRSLALSARMFC